MNFVGSVKELSYIYLQSFNYLKVSQYILGIYITYLTYIHLVPNAIYHSQVNFLPIRENIARCSEPPILEENNICHHLT